MAPPSSDKQIIRVGIASRYFLSSHSVGVLSIRLIELLSSYNRDPNNKDDAVGDAPAAEGVRFHVTVYFIASLQLPGDEMQLRILEAAHKIVFLPSGERHLGFRKIYPPPWSHWSLCYRFKHMCDRYPKGSSGHACLSRDRLAVHKLSELLSLSHADCLSRHRPCDLLSGLQ